MVGSGRPGKPLNRPARGQAVQPSTTCSCRGELSRWHRIDATEIWHFYAGAPLQLDLSHDGVVSQRLMLGTAFDQDQLPQRVVPAGAWQAARSLGDWSLVGCTVTPAFEFAGFELAPPAWRPGE